MLTRKTPLRRTGRLKPVSAKRRVQNREYSEARIGFLEAHPRCAVYPHLPSLQVHHIDGREGNLLNDQAKWLAVSPAGHDWIHAHPNEARKRGWLV